jgi:hypothetical protein
MAANATIVSEASAFWSDEDEAEDTAVLNQTIKRMQPIIEEEEDETSTDGQPRHEPRSDNHKSYVFGPMGETVDWWQLPQVIADHEIPGPDSRPGPKRVHFPPDHSKGKSRLADDYGVRAPADNEPPFYHRPTYEDSEDKAKGRLPRKRYGGGGRVYEGEPEKVGKRFGLRDERYRSDGPPKARPVPTVHKSYTTPPIVPESPPRPTRPK